MQGTGWLPLKKAIASHQQKSPLHSMGGLFTGGCFLGGKGFELDRALSRLGQRNKFGHRHFFGTALKIKVAGKLALR